MTDPIGSYDFADIVALFAAVVGDPIVGEAGGGCRELWGVGPHGQVIACGPASEPWMPDEDGRVHVRGFDVLLYAGGADAYRDGDEEGLTARENIPPTLDALGAALREAAGVTR